jgi:hypothetical protein
MKCHSDVLSWVDVLDGLMYRWVDVKDVHCCIIMVELSYHG